MNTASRILGAHVWFAREGLSFTLPAPGTVSKTAKPQGGATPDTVWMYFGNIKDASIEPSGEVVEVWAPAPGNLRLQDMIEIKPGLKVTFTVQDLGPTAVELIFRTAALTDQSTEFTPLSVTGGIKGWLKLQCYDQSDARTFTVDVYAFMKATGSLKADATAPAEVTLEAQVLNSALNIGGF